MWRNRQRFEDSLSGDTLLDRVMAIWVNSAWIYQVCIISLGGPDLPTMACFEPRLGDIGRVGGPVHLEAQAKVCGCGEDLVWPHGSASHTGCLKVLKKKNTSAVIVGCSKLGARKKNLPLFYFPFGGCRPTVEPMIFWARLWAASFKPPHR